MERELHAHIEFQAKISNSDDILNFNQSFVQSELKSISYQYPLKLLLPSLLTEKSCHWIYPIIFGGGLVEGDNVNIDVKLQKKCCAVFASLAFPKVYCCEKGKLSQQNSNYVVECDSLLCILPDPLVCFKKASYIQKQNINLDENGNLVILDWFTSGRYARGERWEFTQIKTTSSIYINGVLRFKESQDIRETPFLSIKHSMKSYNIVGTCMIMGHSLKNLSSRVLEVLGKRRGYGEKPSPDSLFAVSPLHLNDDSELFGCIIRLASVSVPGAIKKMEELLEPLFSIIGDNPFNNK